MKDYFNSILSISIVVTMLWGSVVLLFQLVTMFQDSNLFGFLLYFFFAFVIIPFNGLIAGLFTFIVGGIVGLPIYAIFKLIKQQ